MYWRSVHVWRLVLLNRHICGNSKITLLEQILRAKRYSTMAIYLNCIVALYRKYWWHVAQSCISQYQCNSQVCRVLFVILQHGVLHRARCIGLLLFYCLRHVNLGGDFRCPCTLHRTEDPRVCCSQSLGHILRWQSQLLPDLLVLMSDPWCPGRTGVCHPIPKLQ